MSSCSAARWVTRAIGPPLATAALSALTLFSRPTWSGHDHLREDDRLPEGDEGQLPASSIRQPLASSGVRRSVSHQRVSCGCGRCDRAGAVRPAHSSSGVGGIGFVEERLEDPGPEALLELEQDPDPGQVDAPVLGQVTDPQDPPDVVLAVEPDVRRGPGRAEQALVLVDPQRARMDADDARRHADDVDGSRRIPLGPSGHRQACGLRGRSGASDAAIGWRVGRRGDPDLARLDLLGLGDPQGEHAVLERRAGLVRLEALGQGDGPGEARRGGSRGRGTSPRPRCAPPGRAADRVTVPPSTVISTSSGRTPGSDASIVRLVRVGSDVERHRAERGTVPGEPQERADEVVIEEPIHRLAEREQLVERRRTAHASSWSCTS